MGKSSHRHLQMLSERELNKLTTKRLLGVLARVRAVRHCERRWRIAQRWCCEICKEWLGTKEQFEEEVNKPTAHLTGYMNRVKEILATREHVK
jgi:hypothetical protein